MGSNLRPSRFHPARGSTARFLALAAQATAALFAISVGSVLVPVSLLTPSWQHQQIAALVNNGVIALLALVLIALAYALDPRNPRVKMLRDRFRRLAVAAAFGYLLLVPLAIGSLAGQIEGEQRQWLERRAQVNRRYDAMRDLIERAPSLEALQQGLTRLEGPALGPPDLAAPLPSLRRRLAAVLQKGRAELLERMGPVDPTRRMLMVRDTARLILSSVVFAVAFAAGGARSEASGSFLAAALNGASALKQRLRTGPGPSTPAPASSPTGGMAPTGTPVRTRRRRRSRPS